jgi:hypothetical protein
LVVRLIDTAEVFVGDVKYKQWAGVPGASDVYQLLVHAAAFDSGKAFLVFPFEEFDARSLGDAVTGASVTTYGVDVRELDDHVEHILNDLGAVPALGAVAPPGAA